MQQETAGTEILDTDACWKMLRQTPIGRLAIELDGQPDLFPVNFVADGRTLVFRSNEGSKLAGSVHVQRIAFEIDGFGPAVNETWSVIVKGHAREVNDPRELQEVECLPLVPWGIDDKPVFVRIIPSLITGRRFRVDDDVVADDSVGWDRNLRRK
jgi:hypothetical protein